MKRIADTLGSVGLGALAAGTLIWLFAPHRDRIWASFLIAGLALIVFFLGTRWREVMAFTGQRRTRHGANLVVLIVLVICIVSAINYLANRHNKRWDLTAAKQFTLSEQSVKILSNLKRDLQVFVLDRREQAQPALDLLRQYRYHTERIVVEVVDQEAQPGRAAEFKTATETTIPLGTIVIDGGDRIERVSSATEQDITNAIIKVLKEGKKKIYFVEGHGEKDPDASSASDISFIKAKLEESNYEVARFHPLQSMNEGTIELPADADAVIVAGPVQDFLPAEINAFRSFLTAGGKAIFLIDPEDRGPRPNLNSLMTELGIELGDNVVIDNTGIGQLFGFGPEVPLVTSYGYHAITDRFGNMATVYPVSRTVIPAEETPEGISATELVTSSENSWAEENDEELASGKVRPDESEMTGPLSLAVALTIRQETPAEAFSEESEEPGEEEDSNESASDDESEEEAQSDGRAVVVGDSDFITNSLTQAPIGNMDLFLNMVNWIAEDEDLIAVRPREAEDRRVFMNAQQQRNVGYISLLMIPGVILLTGVYVWWGRR